MVLYIEGHSYHCEDILTMVRRACEAVRRNEFNFFLQAPQIANHTKSNSQLCELPH